MKIQSQQEYLRQAAGMNKTPEEESLAKIETLKTITKIAVGVLLVTAVVALLPLASHAISPLIFSTIGGTIAGIAAGIAIRCFCIAKSKEAEHEAQRKLIDDVTGIGGSTIRENPPWHARSALMKQLSHIAEKILDKETSLTIDEYIDFAQTELVAAKDTEEEFFWKALKEALEDIKEIGVYEHDDEVSLKDILTSISYAQSPSIEERIHTLENNREALPFPDDSIEKIPSKAKITEVLDTVKDYRTKEALLRSLTRMQITHFSKGEYKEVQQIQEIKILIDNDQVEKAS